MKLLVVLLATLVTLLSCNAEKKLSKAYDKVAADAPAPAPANKNKLLPYFLTNFPTKAQTDSFVQYIKGDTETIIDSLPYEVTDSLYVIEEIPKTTVKYRLRVDTLKIKVKEVKVDSATNKLLANQITTLSLRNVNLEEEKAKLQKKIDSLKETNKTLWIVIISTWVLLIGGFILKLKKII